VTSADLAKLSTSLWIAEDATEHSSGARCRALWPKRPLNFSVSAPFRSSRFFRLISFSRRLSESLEFTEKLPSDCEVLRRLGAVCDIAADIPLAQTPRGILGGKNQEPALHTA